MLTEKYRLDKLLAVGGMGAVYSGTHMQLEKRVAIKVLRKEFSESQDMIQRFQREAIAASRIGHENIVEVTDMGTAFDASSYIVMEYLVGEDLAGRIKRDGPMSVSQAADVCNEILAAMSAAHAAGIVHRDLKPENVFLQTQSRGERVKIVDFGISRMTATEDENYRLTVSGLVMGTPHYMSPEQACGDSNISYKADIYAIGVILYELLTANVPFKATNYNALMYQVLSGEYPAPSCFASVPADLEAIIQRAMSLVPDDRFSSAAQFAEALHPYVPLRTDSSGNPAMPGHLITVDTATPVTTLGNPPAMKRILNTVRAMPGSLPNVAVADTLALPTSDAAAATPAPQGRPIVYIALALAAIGAVAGGILMLQGENKGDEKMADTPALPAVVEQEAAQEPAITPPPAEVQKAPAKVTLSFVLTPPDAQVLVGGTPIADNRIIRDQVDELLTVVVSREGYQSKERELRLDSSREVEIVLIKDESTVEDTLPSTGKVAKKKRGSKIKRKVKRTNKRIISDSPYD